jgi:opacity protein-like surface antigen
MLPGGTMRCGVALLVAIGSVAAAHAADMPLKARPPAAALSWSGCYIGLHAGVGDSFDQWDYRNSINGIVGGQVGCNYQTGAIVVGIEAEGAWAGSSSRFHLAQPGFSDDFTGRNRWEGDVALRAGVAVDSALIYGKVGAARSRFDFAYADSFGDLQSGSGTLTGLLLGAGLEYAFAPNWSAKLEYNHVSYLARSFHFVDPVFLFDYNESVSATKHVVKAGINYRFAGPWTATGAAASAYAAAPAAAYNWTGCYIGLHGGGGAQYDAWTFVNGGGGIAGAHTGCNYQSGALVFGLEAEGAWSGIAGTFHYDDPGFMENVQARNRWDVDVALRSGLALDRALLYTKVGAAWGRFDVTADDNFGSFQRGTGTLTGLLFGAGVEYALAGPWTAKLEYNYVGYLGKVVHVQGGGGFLTRDLTVSATKNVVKAGINYRFGDPSVSSGGMPVLPAAAYNWTGCYVGVQGGGGALYHDFAGRNGGGILGGGQVGCDYQTGRFVFGIEGEGWWSGLVSSGFSTTTTTATTNRARNPWSVDVAARAGFATDQALIYGKVGAAWAQFNMDRDVSTGAFNRGSSTNPGLLLGGGLEYAFAPNWTGRVEYNYIGYVGKEAHIVTRSAAGVMSFFDETYSASSHVLKAGINYRFGQM